MSNRASMVPCNVKARKPVEKNGWAAAQVSKWAGADPVSSTTMRANPANCDPCAPVNTKGGYRRLTGNPCFLLFAASPGGAASASNTPRALGQKGRRKTRDQRADPSLIHLAMHRTRIPAEGQYVLNFADRNRRQVKMRQRLPRGHPVTRRSVASAGATRSRPGM